MATLVCPTEADSPERPSTPAPLGCGTDHTSPEEAQRIPGNDGYITQCVYVSEDE